jgi:putative tricarboxylic transport membrane protein
LRSLSADRLAALALLAVAVVYAVEARGFETGFIADPIGPRAFPYVLGMILSVLSLSLLAKPDEESVWPLASFSRQSGLVVVGLLLYAAILTRLGFLLSTCLLSTLVSIVFGGRRWRALAFGVASSLLTYLVFDRVLGLSLPVGTVFAGLFSWGPG